MDNQHKKITGYRDLNQSEIDGFISIKALEADAADLVKQLKALPDADQRAMALAVTNLQQACMWLTKGVARSHNPFA
jgi:hypothetical protein